MKRKLIFIILFFAIVLFSAGAEEAESQPKNYIGVNIAHPVIIYSVSTVLNPGTVYLPVHILYSRSLDKNWGISGLLIYRLEIDGTYFQTSEFGVAAGPRYSFDFIKGLFVEFKIGIGYASGKDYFNADYSRLDLIIQPDLGFDLFLGEHIAITLGIGMQTLILLSESPERSSFPGGGWDWNEIGTLSHYYLPVANLSVGLVF